MRQTQLSKQLQDSERCPHSTS